MFSIGVILATAAAVCWGVVYTLDQKILTGVSPVTLIFLQSLLTVVLLFGYSLVHRGELKSLVTVPRNVLVLLVISLVVTFAANLMILGSIKHLNAATASLLEITYPLFVILFSIVMFKSHFSPMYLLGAALIIIGSGIIVAVNVR